MSAKISDRTLKSPVKLLPPLPRLAKALLDKEPCWKRVHTAVEDLNQE
jgi:hypothetical protein